MIVRCVWGEKLFGHTDGVPGLFEVATKCWHFNYLPVVPLKSYIVLTFDRRQFRGIEIPLNQRSITLAWIRTIGFWVVIAMAVWVIFAKSDFDYDQEHAIDTSFQKTMLLPILAFVISLAAQIFVSCHPFTRHASYERATELTRHLGEPLASRVQVLVDRKFRRGLSTMNEGIDDTIDNDESNRSNMAARQAEYVAVGDVEMAEHFEQEGGPEPEDDEETDEKRQLFTTSSTENLHNDVEPHSTSTEELEGIDTSNNEDSLTGGEGEEEEEFTIV